MVALDGLPVLCSGMYNSISIGILADAFKFRCTVAAAETGRRCVLFTGEGSMQMTIQDVSQLVRLGLKPVLFVLNNNGCAS